MKQRVKQGLYILLAVVAFALLIIVVINSQSPESLMTPPEAAGDYKDIQNVIEKSIGSEIILKAPNEGEYTTSITFVDLNADDANDAVAFYRLKNDDTSAIYMSVLIRQHSKWIASEAVRGQGNDVLEFSYGDMDYDSISEIIVGWSMFDSKDNNTLSVYTVSSQKSKAVVNENDSLIYTKMCVTDVCGEGRKEILLLKNTYNDEDSLAKATVYVFEDSKLSPISSINIVSSVSEYKKLQTQLLDNKNVFFVDGVIESDSMITEILYWDNSLNKLVSPTNTQGAYPQTLRKGTVCSTDINSDSILEIPFENVSIGKPYINLTDWKQFDMKEYKTVMHGVCTDELIFNFPDSWKNNVVVTKKGSVWSFYDISSGNNDKLFDLVAAGLSDWQQFSKDYDKLKIDYGTIYGVKLTSSKSKLALNRNEIAKAIVNIR